MVLSKLYSWPALAGTCLHSWSGLSVLGLCIHITPFLPQQWKLPTFVSYWCLDYFSFHATEVTLNQAIIICLCPLTSLDLLTFCTWRWAFLCSVLFWGVGEYLDWLSPLLRMFLLPQCLLFLMLLRLSWFYLEAEVSLAIEACQLSPYKSRVWCTSYLYFPVSVLFCVPWTSLIGTGGFLVSDFCIIYELQSWSNYWQYQFPCQTDKFVPLSWTQPARQMLGHRSESGPKIRIKPVNADKRQEQTLEEELCFIFLILDSSSESSAHSHSQIHITPNRQSELTSASCMYAA